LVLTQPAASSAAAETARTLTIVFFIGLDPSMV
jgi:hypothetical protein